MNGEREDQDDPSEDPEMAADDPQDETEAVDEFGETTEVANLLDVSPSTARGMKQDGSLRPPPKEPEGS
jgi:hypothetical protein